MSSVLMLAYYFPPMGLGGVQRALKFARYLPEYGWRPVVITVKNVRYYGYDPSLLDELPETVCVERTESLDPLRLAYLIGNKSHSDKAKVTAGPAWLRRICFPDYQAGWIPFAVARGLRVISREPVEAIFSTFPPASAHWAGHLLHRLTGLPHIADFRDAWTGGEFERFRGDAGRHLTERLQKTILDTAACITAVSEGIGTQLLTARPGSVVRILPNGFDPADFATPAPTPHPDRFVLTCCGAFNTARNPEPLLRALRRLWDRNPAAASRVEVRLAGAAVGIDLAGIIRSYRLEKTLFPLGYLTHREAVTQMLEADALALFITSDTAEAMDVPTGKIYEYLAAGKPVLCIAPDGAASRLITAYGRGTTLSPDRIDDMANTLETWVAQHIQGMFPVFPVNTPSLASFTRPFLAEQLARVLDTAAIH
ncbi:MAG: glycosyltransferase [candidate division Zixibacteria bacterium]|nr:glycosyltransferase [candidate division Zixibacteria bacterium]